MGKEFFFQAKNQIELRIIGTVGALWARNIYT
jgi:hypothetical protein